MDARSTRFRLLAIALTSFLTLPATAGALYKSIDSDGAIVFTDVAPSAVAPTVAQSPTPRFEITEPDEAVARANARIDAAEHNLAVARHGLPSQHDGLGLAAERMTPGDRARVEFYKQGVQLARRQLIDLLRERQASPSFAAR